MKKIILLLLVAFPLISFCQTQSITDVVGVWEGEDKGDIGSFIFDKDGFAYMVFNEKKMGGEDFDMNGVRAKMTYQFNFEATPTEVDIIITLLETDETKSLDGIVKFLDNNTMDLAMNFKGTRPVDFDIKEDVIRLHRKEVKQ